MHPIEGFLYKTAMLMPCFFYFHPVLIHLIKIELDISAYLGHAGYDKPGSGDWYHAIHHMKMDCNYGTPAFPLDWLFGTLNYGKNGSEYEKENKKYFQELKTN